MSKKTIKKLVPLGTIYVIRCGQTEYYKIGTTHNVPQRMVDLQVGSPYELTLIVSRTFACRLKKEREYHKWLAEFHVRGEWFVLSPMKLEKLKFKLMNDKFS